MICIKCGKEIPNNSKFCKICGAPQKPADVLCKSCGAPMPRGTPYCPKCGASQKEVAALCCSCDKPIPLGSTHCPNCGAVQKWNMTACRSCNRPMKSNLDFCPYCGATQKVTPATCRKCGNQIEPDEFFCQFCGTPQNPALEYQTPYGKKTPPVAKKRGGCLTIWLILVIIFSLIGLGFGLTLARSRAIEYGSPWIRYAFMIIPALSIIFATAIFKWQKWGFYGLVLTSLAGTGLVLFMHTHLYSIISSIIGLLILVLLVTSRWKYFN